jgi:hypothetical protein
MSDAWDKAKLEGAKALSLAVHPGQHASVKDYWETRRVEYHAAFQLQAEAVLRAAFPILAAWQPIETAPRDGTAVVGWTGYGCSILAWVDDQPCSSDDPGMAAGWLARDGEACPACPALGVEAQGQPTHWMPLPAPPAAAQEG